jgi:hypothetical protein
MDDQIVSRQATGCILVRDSEVVMANPVFWGLILFSALQAARPAATVSPQAFVGTWVGTQSWAIEKPPPGARPDQAVSLTIDLAGGKLFGTMTPFLGGDDGATFVDAEIVGDQLQALATAGKPRAAQGRPPAGDETPPAAAPGRGGRRGAAPLGWKDQMTIQFAFKPDGVNLTGTADVMLGDVKWLKFNYDLSKKRQRY